MFITAATAPESLMVDDITRWQSTATHLIGWRGNLFFPGKTAGEPSIVHLLERLGRGAGTEVFQDIDGIYGLFLFDRAAREWTVACDNSGLYRIFYSRGGLSTSFLELLREAGEDPLAIDDAAVLEFLMHGGNFGPQTPLQGIRKLRRDEVLKLGTSPRSTCRIIAKPLRDDDGSEDDTAVERYFDHLAQAMTERRISVDLTGGFDTRLIACLLDQRHVPFECALSGVPDSEEHRRALQVAEVMGREFHFHVHDIAGLESDLPAVFAAGDGLTEIPRLHRDRQLCLSRQQRGIEIMLHGGGGGFFQDHYVVQDFPRYGSPHANVTRYYHLRIAPIPLPEDQLTPAAATLRHEVRDGLLAKFERCREPTNNQTYERIAYEYRTPEFYGATFTNYINIGMDVEAPFLNARLIALAMRLPPWRRVFMRWHREVISRNCPRLAALRTVDGYTASSRPTRLLAELGTYAVVQASRVGRKLGERYLGRSLFHKVGELEADAPGYRERLRGSAMLAAAVERLKTQGILRNDLQPDQLRNVHVGRVITMGTLLRHVDDAWQAHAAPEKAIC
jgi:asparagine synthetase B (glutamine-hydrolysing)